MNWITMDVNCVIMGNELDISEQRIEW